MKVFSLHLKQDSVQINSSGWGQNPQLKVTSDYAPLQVRPF